MPKIFHHLIQRQLRKSSITDLDKISGLRHFVEMVNDAYNDFENDSKLLEHAIEISSREMTQANEQLKNLAEDAQNAAKFKSNFLANMSHEIRTPINGILGVCDILQEKALDEECSGLIELLARSSRGLLTIINDVLDISKIEAGKLSISPRATHIRNLINDLSTLYLAATREKQLELVSCIADQVPELISIDDGRVRQILTNLIGNAVKFTPDHGGVIVHITTGSSTSGSSLVISVADTGIGIPKEQLESIFEAFSQGNSTVSRKFGGTGLGLTITQKLVEIMGGEIHVRSREGVGSLFQVHLPFSHIEVAAFNNSKDTLQVNNTERFIDTSKIHLLLAEDNFINQKVAKHALEKLGFTVSIAHNGKHAIELFQNETFDLILMDCQMPEMSGFEASTLIRKLSGGDKIPIIALTALAMEGDREKCLNAGMNDYISKPFKREELKEVITRWISFSR